MKLWSITLRSLGVTKSDKQSNTLFVVCSATTEKELMAHLYANKFTREWWDGTIVIDIDGPREVWYMQAGGGHD